MSSKIYRTLCLAVGVTAAVAFAGCTNYVKRSDFDAAITKLQNTDQGLQQQIDSLSQDMKNQFAKYDTEITAMQGRIQVDTVAHFAFNQAALQGSKPSDAFQVKCDKTTTTQDDINNGIVNIIVAFAPLKPAEFVVIKIAHLAGQAKS